MPARSLPARWALLLAASTLALALAGCGRKDEAAAPAATPAASTSANTESSPPASAPDTPPASTAAMPDSSATAASDAGAAPASAVMGGAATASVDGAAVYNQACVACHGAGVAGAPKLGDKADWAPRIAQGKDTLYAHSLQGYQGKKGYMPPRGGSTKSDDEVRAAVDYMVSQGQ